MKRIPPRAFLRILRLVIEQNLIRFGAVVRAASTWTGLLFEAAKPGVTGKILLKLQDLLDKPEECRAVLSNGAPEDQYLALWSMAYFDAGQAIAAAQPLLKHPDVNHRFIAVFFLTRFNWKKVQSCYSPCWRTTIFESPYLPMPG